MCPRWPPNGNVTVDFVSYRQYRPTQQIPNTVGYNVHGDAFPTAPEALTIVDARNGATIATLNMTATATSFAAGSAWEVPAAQSEAVFQLLLSGSARLVVHLANDASVIVPLAVDVQEDWHRPNCS